MAINGSDCEAPAVKAASSERAAIATSYRSSQARLDPLVEFMLSQPGMPEDLIERHRDDGSGHCLVCSTGISTGRLSWPCALAVTARIALSIRQQAAR